MKHTLTQPDIASVLSGRLSSGEGRGPALGLSSGSAGPATSMNAEAVMPFDLAASLGKPPPHELSPVGSQYNPHPLFMQYKVSLPWDDIKPPLLQQGMFTSEPLFPHL